LSQGPALALVAVAARVVLLAETPHSRGRPTTI